MLLFKITRYCFSLLAFRTHAESSGIDQKAKVYVAFTIRSPVYISPTNSDNTEKKKKDRFGIS